jgi:outer membrane protein TolC
MADYDSGGIPGPFIRKSEEERQAHKSHADSDARLLKLVGDFRFALKVTRGALDDLNRARERVKELELVAVEADEKYRVARRKFEEEVARG